MKHLASAVCTLLTGMLFFLTANAQTSISVEQAIDRVLTSSSLTPSNAPFHAVLDITGPTRAYSGQLDLIWLTAGEYRLSISTPAYNEIRTVKAGQTQQTITGDYYPRWLQNFVDALLAPSTLMTNFRSSSLINLGSASLNSCVRRDDRPGGITDQLTWGVLCFTGSEPRLSSVQAFTTSLELSDYKPFHGQQIARTYTTNVLAYQSVTGKLATLENIDNPQDHQLSMSAATTPSAILQTAFVSTLKEESLIGQPPNFNWPTVREGKTEGYMIVYARTDRTGQVRETSKHNSDNPGLEQFGMEQALTLKFHPLLINGIPQQIEMPLVLHFTSTLADPLPVLDDAAMRTHISGCSIPSASAAKPSYRLKLSVNEQGKLTGEGFPDSNSPGYISPTRFLDLRNCRFSPLLLNANPTYYHGILILPR